MNYTPTERALIEAMEQMDIIDAHEHLPPESARTGATVDALWLFGHYTRTDLVCAGMAADDYQRLTDPAIPLKKRWRMFRPYLPAVRYGSYARPAFIAAKEFYGADDINDRTYEAITQRMREQNTPGIYRRILRDRCRIRACLTQCGCTDTGSELLVPLMPIHHLSWLQSADDVAKRSDEFGVSVRDLDDWLVLCKKALRRWKSEGAVGIKMVAHPNVPDDRRQAYRLFSQVLKGCTSRDELPWPSVLREFITHEVLDMAGGLDLVVAVHTGMWGDFRTLDPKHLITVLPRHPNTRFDVYHMGMPWVRETGVIGKNNPNAWMNLCWCHIISQKMTCAALDEWLDMVPVNKIIGFGGDYGRPVEKVYGHLVMAREDLATVLGGRVDRGFMDLAEATALAHRFLYTNPKELYRLNV